MLLRVLTATVRPASCRTFRTALSFATMRAPKSFWPAPCADVPGAIAQLRKSLEIDSTFTLAHVELARSLASQGKVDDALTELARAPDFTYRYEAAPVIYSLAKAGRTAEARRLLADRLSHAQQSHIDAVGNALIYVGLGETDEAFKWLNRARIDRPWSLTLLAAEPLWAPVTNDPRFVATLRELRLHSATAPR